MADDVRVVASGSTTRRRGVSTGTVLAVIAALLIGLLVGRLTSGGDDDSPPAPKRGQDVGPTRSVNGVPVGYAHSREGAVAATLNYGAVLAGPEFLDPERRREILRIVAVPEYASEVERSAAPGLAQVERGPIGRSLAAGEPTLFKGAPISYRVVRYSADEAIVAVWGVALVGSDELQPQADYQTTTSTLRWVNGDWKFAAGRSNDGPTPALSNGTRPTPGTRFLQAIDGFEGLRYAP